MTEEQLEELTIMSLFPLAEASEVTCGNRTDLPKKERTHQLVKLGKDMRNKGEKGYIERDVYACARCGRDIDKPVTS